MRTVWQNAQNSKSSFRWVPPGSRRNVHWNLFTAISWIYWSQTLRNATGRLSAICCWCVFPWSKTSQNRPSHSRLNLKIFAVPYLGQNSSKFPPKPLLVEKLVSRQYIAAIFLCSTFSQRLQLDHKHLWISLLSVSQTYEPENTKKSSGVVHCVTDGM